jgi:hypothetical protein
MRMSSREKLIEKLVCEMHLSVPERAALSPKIVRYSEVTSVIRRSLDERGFFPPNARPWQEGQLVYEGAMLQRLSNRKFRVTIQRSHPVAPNVLAAKKERDYVLAGTAIRAFVRVEWPNDIDGIRISRIKILGI